MRHGANIESNVQLEVGATDIASLEPCDVNLRPFRRLEKTKDPLGKNIFQKELNLESLFRLIEGDENTTELSNQEIKIKKNLLIKGQITLIEWEAYSSIILKIFY